MNKIGKMKLSLILFLFAISTARSQGNSAIVNKGATYVDNPNPDDTLCIANVKRAQQDIKNGKLVFTQDMGFMFGMIRYENELRQLCKAHGLEFDFELIGCVFFKGQTQGCYGSYMDKIIAERFGSNFKEKLHSEADSLLLSNVISKKESVVYWNCDERPRLPNEKKRTHDEIPSLSILNFDTAGKSVEYYGSVYFDIGFTIELDGSINDFHENNFAGTSGNEQFRKDLFALAVKHVRSTYPIWVPGKIRGVPVRTDNNVRILIHRGS